MNQVEQEEERGRRHAALEESFSEDGVPVRNKKYAAYKRDGQGRVEIPQHNFTNIDFYKKEKILAIPMKAIARDQLWNRVQGVQRLVPA